MPQLNNWGIFISQKHGSIMLVLSRRKNESVKIGDDITIVVVDIRGDKVRLGIEAPSSVPVHRREVYDAIHRSSATTEVEKTEKDPDSDPKNVQNK